ncbi:conserved exported protein of unknown function [Nitrospira sp. KM1]|uniref:LPP20 family lipoprotein n=1 Tax=Nitrospira sp. KM1 TaxID=1936990 RepID=UPI0013A7243F|nr:LPP20 family lipoprotein [Nitrospira sp. KM1]BCA53980.1 conserved exported protein of unknown function [Nitrospira sp. KM1]
MTRQIIIALGVFGWLITGCTSFGGPSKPAWIDGTSPEYPSSQYLVGVGQADNRHAAEDQAYAALARIFKSEISAQSKDWESYLVVEQSGRARDERRLTLDNLTQVSTDKVLENVRIADRWLDPKKGLSYALAVMQRSQAETAFKEKIADLDHSIQDDVAESRHASDKLVKVRGMRRAIRNLVLRETYNTDLRVIRMSGQGIAPPYRVNELTQELDQFLDAHLAVGVLVSGDQAEPVQRALSEGLIKEGLHVMGRASSGSILDASAADHPVDVLVRGLVRVWPIDVRDPQFVYVRWCSDFEVLDVDGQRVVGAISKGGKEGHLSEREANAKVVRVMQQEFSSDVARAIAAHVYGESELPAQAIRPAGCPSEGLKPGATH